MSRWLRTGARRQSAHCRRLAQALGVEADYVLALCGYPAGQASTPPAEDTFMLFWATHANRLTTAQQQLLLAVAREFLRDQP